MIATTFLTALGGWAACAAAVASAFAGFLGLMNRRHIQEVHVLVNSNLTEIKRQLAAVTAERDQLTRTEEH